MAIIDRLGRIRGSIGALTYRVLNGQNIIQTKPGKGGVKQTRGTKNSASEFGLASTTGLVIRDAMGPVIYRWYDGKMINRLQGIILKALSASSKDRGERDFYDTDVTLLDGFEFNTESTLADTLKVKPALTVQENGDIAVTLPSFHPYHDMRFPSASDGLYIRVVLAAFNFREQFVQYCGFEEIEIKSGALTGDLQWTFSNQIPAGCVVLVTMSLHFFKKMALIDKISTNGKDLHPAAIVGAFTTASDAETAVNSQFNQMTERLPMDGYNGNQILKDIQRHKTTQKKKDTFLNISFWKNKMLKK